MREPAHLDGFLDLTLAHEAVRDRDDPDEREAGSEDRVGPPRLVCEARDDPADPDARGERGQSGPPPRQIRPLVGGSPALDDPLSAGGAIGSFD
jgi:hypothetical protein